MIYTILIGLIAGAIAKALMPGKGPEGCVITILLGLAGSWVGGWLASMAGMSSNVGLIGSVVGAMVILAVARMLSK
ncbi:MAG TPA: GlsB/YeaQ/YmgE family stress response membrane protein [Gemmatimonadales bacterium]|nr:GlsB/YeaQ/YmgE family stress response membrane protein [Gemmatimonadales bacterium]